MGTGIMHNTIFSPLDLGPTDLWHHVVSAIHRPPCAVRRYLCTEKTTEWIFGDLSDPGSRVYKLIHIPDKVVWVLRPETGTLPNVFYMND